MRTENGQPVSLPFNYKDVAARQEPEAEHRAEARRHGGRAVTCPRRCVAALPCCWRCSPPRSRRRATPGPFGGLVRPHAGAHRPRVHARSSSAAPSAASTTATLVGRSRDRGPSAAPTGVAGGANDGLVVRTPARSAAAARRRAAAPTRSFTPSPVVRRAVLRRRRAACTPRSTTRFDARRDGRRTAARRSSSLLPGCRCRAPDVDACRAIRFAVAR